MNCIRGDSLTGIDGLVFAHNRSSVADGGGDFKFFWLFLNGREFLIKGIAGLLAAVMLGFEPDEPKMVERIVESDSFMWTPP